MSHPQHKVPRPEKCDPASAVAIGRFHAFWRGDPLPILPSLHGLDLTPGEDCRTMCSMTVIDDVTCRQRIRLGHQPWLALMMGKAVGWGWCATAELEIGELDISCRLPPGDRYLWDFFTLPAWRGHGIYPRLLQAIVADEHQAERFWVGHDMPNDASARGIAKAGFREVGILYQLPGGGFVLDPSSSWARAAAACNLFGVALAGQQRELIT